MAISIIHLLKVKVGKLEHQIDRMVYELYELTKEEIEVVEGGKH